MLTFISSYDRINIKQYKEISIMSVSAQTFKNWNAKGKLYSHYISGKTYRYHSHEQLNQKVT